MPLTSCVSRSAPATRRAARRTHDVEGHFDLRHLGGSRRNASKLELAELAIVLGHRAFAFEDLCIRRHLKFSLDELARTHLDYDAGLIVGIGRERFALLARKRRVALDESSEFAAGRFETDRERRNVEQEQVGRLFGSITADDGSLHGGTVGDSFVGVYRLVKLLAAKVVGDELLNARDASRAADLCAASTLTRRCSRNQRTRTISSTWSLLILAS